MDGAGAKAKSLSGTAYWDLWIESFLGRRSITVRTHFLSQIGQCNLTRTHTDWLPLKYYRWWIHRSSGASHYLRSSSSGMCARLHCKVLQSIIADPGIPSPVWSPRRSINLAPRIAIGKADQGYRRSEWTLLPQRRRRCAFPCYSLVRAV